MCLCVGICVYGNVCVSVGVGVCAFVGVDDDVGAGVILGVVQTVTQTTIWLTSFIWEKGKFWRQEEQR